MFLYVLLKVVNMQKSHSPEVEVLALHAFAATKAVN